MKKTRKTTTSVFKKQDEKGVAIITVLSVLMLMTVMVISFFTMATNELNASRSTAEGLRAISAKDIAINLAIAQIREATTRENTIWVSQPGAIRVYGSRATTGRASSIYKLYSSSSMIAGGMRDLQKDMPQNWNRQPNQYVDLNRPVINPDPTDPENIARASIHFPIVDPRAFKGGRGSEGSVEGFSYDTQGIPGIVAGGTDHLKRLPMPVQWLYILADGSVGYLDSQNRFVGTIMPTTENPLTSRIAFWTDDESCKVNVNTASEGVFWDTPRVDTKEERLFATHQPQTGEFQRYPGHPAQTCLSTVLFPYGGSLAEDKRLDPEADREKFKALWTIAPGIGIEGSVGGTVKLSEITGDGVSPFPEEYHLYTAPEEILFDSEQLQGANRRLHPEITQEKLETAKFFLTARSRAPEISMLGYPRMSMWPMPNDRNRRSAFDKVIAFATTINRQPYFFQRQDAYSRHWEFYINSAARNDHLYQAWQTAMNDPIPGFGYSFKDKYGGGRFDDRDNILAETLDYFRGTNLYDPTNKRWQYTQGSASGRGKFDQTVGHGQIAAICLCGGSGPHNDRWWNSRLPLPKGFGRMYGVSEVAILLSARAETGRPSPEDPEQTVPYFGDKSDLEDYPVDDPIWPAGQDQPSPNLKLVQLGILIETFAPAHGWTTLQAQNSISIGGGVGNREEDLPETFTLAGQRLQRVTRDRGAVRKRDFPWYSLSHRPNRTYNGVRNERQKNFIAWGGYGGIRVFDRILTFPPVKVNADAATIDFGGSEDRRTPVRLILYDNHVNENSFTGGNTGNLIQSYQLKFPAAAFPVPSTTKAQGFKWRDYDARMKEAIASGTPIFNERDVVKSLVPTHGDYRIITSKRVVEPESFVPHPDYFDSSTNFAHSLMDYTSKSDNGVTLLFNGSMEKFLDLDYPEGKQPDFPIGPDDRERWALDVDKRAGSERKPYTPEETGDFDQGVGNAPDGAYINRPDDGDTRGLSDSGDPYFDNNHDNREAASSAFSPNRVIPSPGMLGSLSTGVQSNVPWQTLLFRPMPKSAHFGARQLPDHLWMDYFWMPVVQPYVISEPFSTAGKINMNYQILPFQYIRRATGLHAVMKAEKMLAIPNRSTSDYKTGSSAEWRKFIDIDETLKQWDEKFDRGDAFRSATEICDMYLVPHGEQWSSESGMVKFWKDHKATGDNTKERPYTNLYPRLTVRSNTFKVHVVSQSLVKVKGTEPDTFDERRDRIAGEFRGSAIIERAISPNDEDLPNYGRELQKGEKPQSLDLFYTYRIVNEKRFAP